jgi:hypothetical protein
VITRYERQIQLHELTVRWLDQELEKWRADAPLQLFLHVAQHRLQATITYDDLQRTQSSRSWPRASGVSLSVECCH